MTKKYATKNDLPQTVRDAMIGLLNENLATGAHLTLQAKQAHWNVKGPAFFSLHELFDQVYAASIEWVDSLAERAVQLGGVAEATLSVIQTRTKLSAYGLDHSSGPDHLEALSRSLAVFGASVRKASDEAGAKGDADTADLFTEVSRGVDKMLWFVEAHQQADR